jgi:G3E family GTPase
MRILQNISSHAHVITGSFGAGKTTAIRWLMSHKPPQEFWVVILNEFTDAGIDALSVAESANGTYDVRLVAGGCLCCVGELEFGKQLRDILKSLKPTRLLIEPSGAGHAADIVDELAAYETQRALTLDSVICLVDALDATRILEHREANEWSQIQSADVLLLSKADLAGETERRAFAEIAAAQYPAKAFIGECTQGVLPSEALQSYLRTPGFSLVRDAESSSTTQEFSLCGLPGVAGTVAGTETHIRQLGLWAVNWTLPRELTFSRVVIEPRINWMLEAYQTWIKRFKGVFRTGPGPSWLIQSHGRGLSAEDSAYRRDSRLEVVFDAKPTEDFLEGWRSLLREAALAPRR